MSCRIVFESVNQFGQIERHIHYTNNIDRAREEEGQLQNRLNWMTERDRDPEHGRHY